MSKHSSDISEQIEQVELDTKRDLKSRRRRCFDHVNWNVAWNELELC